MSELQELVKRFLEHSPPVDPNFQATPDLIGWNIQGGFVCAKCANRLMQRGCWIWSGRDSQAIWSDSEPQSSCIGCQ